MKIQTGEEKGVKTVEVIGDLDFHTSSQLREVLNRLTADGGDTILVNLKKVDYMDSSGIATFVEAFQKTKQSSGRLVLAELTQPVKSIFEIAKLESIFEIADSHEEALNQLTA